MPSSNKTPTIGISLWTDTEYLKMADFNRDNKLIDEAFQNIGASVANQPRINASGYWEIYNTITGAYEQTQHKAVGTTGATGALLLGKQTACKNAVYLNRFGLGVNLYIFNDSA